MFLNKRKLIISMDNIILTSIIIAVLSILLIIIIYNSNVSLGKFINKFFPCNQNLNNSFPCYGLYEIYIIVFLTILLIGSLIIILIKSLR